MDGEGGGCVCVWLWLCEMHAFSDTHTYTHTHTQLGNALFSLGEYQAALKQHRQDAALSRRLQDNIGEGKAYCNLGNTYKALHRLDRAVDCYEKYRASIPTDATDPVLQAIRVRALENTAGAYSTLAMLCTLPTVSLCMCVCESVCLSVCVCVCVCSKYPVQGCHAYTSAIDSAGCCHLHMHQGMHACTLWHYLVVVDINPPPPPPLLYSTLDDLAIRQDHSGRAVRFFLCSLISSVYP